MTCLPNHTRNERCACEPFVRSYNRFYSQAFSFVEIPDLRDSSQPQPDALYREEQSGVCLTIERKTIIHLAGANAKQSYARRHNNDHRIMDYLFTHLKPEIAHGPFVLEMPFLHMAKWDDDILQQAKDVCDFIHENMEALFQEGELAFYSEEPCPGEYVLYRKDQTRWDELGDGPWSQLLIRMTRPGGRLPRFRWNTIDQSDIPGRVHDFIRRASLKFKTYGAARKVLLLERCGDIRGPLHPAFESLMQAVQKPDELDEIWDARIETPDYDDPYWIFTRLWGRDSFLPEGMSRAEICCRAGCHCHNDSNPDDVFWFTNVKEDDQG